MCVSVCGWWRGRWLAEGGKREGKGEGADVGDCAVEGGFRRRAFGAEEAVHLDVLRYGKVRSEVSGKHGWKAELRGCED